jgi:hypothetical protein
VLLYALTKINKLSQLLLVQTGFGALVGQLMMYGATASHAGDHHALVS